ncbi:hypothetical protein EIP91_005731 [Steccherinum ochraceum]|uniref:Uncharacterized protein n=1 Tax=Steccherinum ochraceum TaxID=92696 RepID=A0A4V2MXF4_9APHY|nr:hypothetical protein EIP91_005731 [Steccherinum ochraceum]
MQIRLGPLPTVLLFNLFAFAHAANFTFDYGDAASCSPFEVSWSGGSPPFQLTLIPVFGTPRFVDIPASNFNNGKGSFSTPIPFPKDQKVLVSMSDASGQGSGGTSDVITVGDALGGKTCNTTDPGVDFFFDLNTALNQCRPFTFSGFDGAVQPVTITGVIPDGSTFILKPPTGPTSFDWLANVKAGTSILFMLSDSKGRKGGSSDVKVVGVSDDNTCLSSSSPATASAAPSHTSTASPTTTSGANSGASSPSKSNVGLIAGLVIAGVFVVAVIGVIVWFMRRRRNHGQFGHRVDLMDPPPGPADEHTAPPIQPYPFAMTTRASTHTGTVSYGAPPLSASSHHLLSEQGSELGGPLTNPYSVYSGGSSVDGRTPGQPYHDDPGYDAVGSASSRPRAPSTTTSGSGKGRSKAEIAGLSPFKPARFIVHTDLEEATPPDEGEEVIELPPQYSESRTPIAALSSPHATTPGIALTPATPASPQPPRDLLR